MDGESGARGATKTSNAMPIVSVDWMIAWTGVPLRTAGGVKGNSRNLRGARVKPRSGQARSTPAVEHEPQTGGQQPQRAGLRHFTVTVAAPPLDLVDTVFGTGVGDPESLDLLGGVGIDEADKPVETLIVIVLVVGRLIFERKNCAIRVLKVECAGLAGIEFLESQKFGLVLREVNRGFRFFAVVGTKFIARFPGELVDGKRATRLRIGLRRLLGTAEHEGGNFPGQRIGKIVGDSDAVDDHGRRWHVRRILAVEFQIVCPAGSVEILSEEVALRHPVMDKDAGYPRVVRVLEICAVEYSHAPIDEVTGGITRR